MFTEITLLNYARPLPLRRDMRRTCGPYKWTPSTPGTGRGFYQAGARGLEVGDSTFSLRLEWADDFLSYSRLKGTTYYCDEDGFCSMRPIIARLPSGRGFLAGWTMGQGMAACVDSTIYAEPEDAARAAHSLAESDAEKERDYREEHRADEEDEEEE